MKTMRAFIPFLLCCCFGNAAAQEGPAPPAKPSPLEGKLIECVADYAAKNYKNLGSPYEIGLGAVKDCKSQADALISYSVSEQVPIMVKSMLNTDEQAAKDSVEIATLFQAQRYATMRIVQRRLDDRKASARGL